MDISYLAIGAILGLSAGFAPGPLLALVISETLKHDIRCGIKVALAPIITDFPIIVATIFILAKLSNFHNIMGAISLFGGFFILYLSFSNIRTKEINLNSSTKRLSSISKGILANALSPHPYLFWFSVGAPTLIKAFQINIITAAAFIASFYTFLIGSKILLSIFVGRSKSFLVGKAYVYTIRLLGFALCLFAVGLFREGLSLLGFLCHN